MTETLQFRKYYKYCAVASASAYLAAGVKARIHTADKHGSTNTLLCSSVMGEKSRLLSGNIFEITH
jgi:hypothetical protein